MLIGLYLGTNKMIFLFLAFRTPFRKVPKINGREIDLYLLYVLVTAHGGWVKVSFFVNIFFQHNFNSLPAIRIC